MNRNIIQKLTRHKVAANIFMFLLILVGCYSAKHLNRQFFPTFVVPVISINTVWPGASAEDVERGITTPLEQELKNLQHIKKMESISRIGNSSISIEYVLGTDMDEANNLVKQKINQVRNLPQTAEKPVITKLTFLDRVTSLLIYGSKNLAQLRPYARRAEQGLKQAGVAKVTLFGLPKQVMSIQVPTYVLAKYQLTLNELAELIQKKSRDIPVGTVGKQAQGLQIRAALQKRSAEAFGQIPILTTAGHRVVYLKDIADIQLEPKSQQVEVYYQGKPAVELSLFRDESTDALAMAKVVNRWVKQQSQAAENTFVHYKTINELWRILQERIDLLIKNGLSGLALIILILLVTLRAKIALWVSAGITVSILGSLAVLFFSGGSLNMISLFAFIMTLGIVVDDAIVVGEEAASQFDRSRDPLRSIDKATSLMLPPVLASSLTTICAFLPLLMIHGISGKILKDIPWVVICVIIASLFECFCILPHHLYQSFLSDSGKPPTKLREK